MSDTARGLILWILAGVGVLYLYAGLKNVTPASLLASFVNPSTPRVPVEQQIGSVGTVAQGQSIGAQALNASGKSSSYTHDSTPLGAVLSV
jgi:hypothetical protein